MEIKYYPIEEINEASYNPRKITEDELAALKASIKKFGLVEPAVYNKRTSTLVGGHQRLRAAKELGYNEYPVFEVDLSEIEEKALNVALNSHVSMGKFDTEMLSEILEEIKLEMPELGIDLRFDVLGTDLKIDFDNLIDFSDAENKKQKFNFITCPHCKEVFEEGQRG